MRMLGVLAYCKLVMTCLYTCALGSVQKMSTKKTGGKTLNMVSSVCTWTPAATAVSETDYYQRYFKSIQILLIAVGCPICILNVALGMPQPEPSVCTPSLMKKQICIDALWSLYKIMPKLIQKKSNNCKYGSKK